jgi:hypothetical protein
MRPCLAAESVRPSVFLFANDLVVAWSADDRCSVTVFRNRTSPAFNVVGGQSAAFESCLNHSARFMRMGTIAKSAKRCQFLYVGKDPKTARKDSPDPLAISRISASTASTACTRPIAMRSGYRRANPQSQGCACEAHRMLVRCRAICIAPGLTDARLGIARGGGSLPR